ENLYQVDAVVMTAAVADFRPSSSGIEKIKKERMPKSIELELNPDILQAVSKKKGNKLVVGFAAESENIIENATKKIKKKDIDLIVANDIASPGVGFGSDLNLAVLINKKGPVGDLITYKKTELAEKILDWVAAHIAVSSISS
ncbi:phosphopantothenoylcysteine decarboxylase, partial [Candidatus Aquicultor secundus]